MRYAFTLAGRTHHVQLEEHADGPKFIVEGESFEPTVEKVGKGIYKVQIGDQSFQFETEHGMIHEGPHPMDVEIHRARPVLQRAGAAGRKADGKVKPPMPGKIVEIHCEEGDTVQEGDTLVVLEAMKMQNDIKAPMDATVEKVHVQDGSNVESSTVLVTLAPQGGDDE